MGQRRQRSADRGSVKGLIAMGQRHQGSADRGSVTGLIAMAQDRIRRVLAARRFFGLDGLWVSVIKGVLTAEASITDIALG